MTIVHIGMGHVVDDIRIVSFLYNENSKII